MKMKFTLTILFLLVVMTRIISLEDRPLHHDESLHQSYAHNFYLDNEKGFYQYRPLLHGPLQFHLIPHLYHLFGFNKFSGRLLAVFFSLILFFFILLYFKNNLANAPPFLIFFIVSPNLLYWSRFMRNDMIVLSMQFLSFFSLFSRWKYRWLIFALSMALQFTAKENFFITVALILSFYGFWYMGKKLLKMKSETMPQTFFTQIFCAIFIFITISFWFFSAEGRYPEGFLDGIYRQSLTYWWAQHSAERIGGSFLYQMKNLLLMEPVFLFLLCHWSYLALRSYTKREWKIFMGSNVFFSILAFLLEQSLKLNSYGEKVFFVLLFSFSITHCYRILRQDNSQKGFLFFFASSQFFIYSFVGEKVPWLGVYPLFWVSFYFLTELKWKQLSSPLKSLFVLAVVLSCYKTYLSNYSHAGGANEILSQVHTAKAFENKIDELSEELSKDKKLLALPGTHWPIHAYLQGKKNYFHHRQANDWGEFNFILAPLEFPHDQEFLIRGFRKETIPWRHWVSTDSFSALDYIVYFFNHSAKSTTGQSHLKLFVKD